MKRMPVAARVCLIILAFYLSTVCTEFSTRVGRELANFHTKFGTGQNQLELAGEGPVYDIGLDWLPHLNYLWLPDLVLFVCIFFCAPLVLLDFPERLGRALDFFERQAALLVIRALSIAATVHRASPRCSAHQLTGKENAGFLLNTACFDLLFSGHSATGALLVAFAMQRPGLSVVARIFLALLAVVNGLVNIMVGDHFSSDVIIAMALAGLIGAFPIRNFPPTRTKQS